MTKAAEQGLPAAQHNLGAMYATGQGVPRDYAQALMWFTLAANNGDTGAKKNCDKITAQMTPDQIAKAQQMAREWKPKTAQQP